MPDPVFTSSPCDAPPLREALRERPLLIVGLCAAWCDTCRTFGADFAALAADRRDTTWVWLDVEDDADLVGDIDVENFPTIAVYRSGRLVHFGVSLPQMALVARLLGTLTDASPTVEADEAVTALPRRLSGRAVVAQ